MVAKVDLAAEDPIEGENIAHTLHFYAGTHRQEPREIAKIAMEKGIALFVTEFGTTNADGDGPVYAEETGNGLNLWIKTTFFGAIGR
jgi:endoglucanase